MGPDRSDPRTAYESGAAPRIGRKQVARIVLWAVFLGLVVALLANNVPIMGAVLLSPVAFFVLLNAGGAVTWLWSILIAISIAFVGEHTDGWTTVFRQSVLAIAIGLTPHAVFLMGLNGELAFTTLGAERVADWARVISSYEKAVALLNDRLGDYLLPSFLLGTSISLAMLAITHWLDQRRLREAWRVIQEGLRFTGLVLLSATTFTLMSAGPAGKWQPDARSLLQARLVTALEAEAKLALSKQALVDRESGSGLTAALRAAAKTIDEPTPADRGRWHKIELRAMAEQRGQTINEIVGKVREQATGKLQPDVDVNRILSAAGLSRSDIDRIGAGSPGSAFDILGIGVPRSDDDILRTDVPRSTIDILGAGVPRYGIKTFHGVEASRSDIDISLDVEASRPDARSISDSLAAKIRDDERQAKEIRDEIARTVGSGIGSIADPLVGKLLAALLEDASTRLARDFIAEKHVRRASELLAALGSSPFATSAHSHVESAVSSMKRVLNDSTLIRKIEHYTREQARVAAEEKRAAEERAARARARSRGGK